MREPEVFAEEVARLGPVAITDPVVTTWALAGVLWLLVWILGRRLRVHPSRAQLIMEGVVGAAEDAVRALLPTHYRMVGPFILSLWLFLVLANLIGLIPGLHSPTRDPSVTAALAILVFLSVHWFGVRSQGWRRYLRHYLMPSPLLLPFHVVSEITRTIALAVRLFGNMMSLELTALLILLVAGFLAPVPILMLHVVEALVQAYIFGMLALVYIAGAIQSQEAARKRGANAEEG